MRASRHYFPRPVAHHEEAFTDAHHADRTVLEERIVVPRSREARKVVTRAGVEISDFLWILRIRDVQNAQPSAVVRLIEPITLHIQIVVTRLRRTDILLDHDRLLEIGDV